ncbi:LysR family transcriptional regulator [Phaeobacter sp. C3_T13_0]|uniref:LysR family transcriptional regulator n=1 Tax=Phaeobacter cretensis TaxID=3342641 RepID=UPI0039BD2BDB
MRSNEYEWAVFIRLRSISLLNDGEERSLMRSQYTQLMAGLAEMGHINVDLLRTFYELAQLKSYTACSKKMNMSQPAISNRMKRLEELVRFPLFIDRNPHKGLTEQAQILFSITQRIMTEFDQIGRMIDTESTRKTRIGVLPAIEFFFGPELLWKLDAPGQVSKFEMLADSEEKLLSEMAAGRLEIAVVCTRIGVQPNSMFVKKCALNWIAGHGFDTNALAPEADVPVVIWNGSVSRGPSAVEILDRNNRKHRVVFETSAISSYFEAIQLGYGVGFTVDAFLSSNRNPYSVKVVDDLLPDLGAIELHVLRSPTAPPASRKLSQRLASVFDGGV